MGPQFESPELPVKDVPPDKPRTDVPVVDEADLSDDWLHDAMVDLFDELPDDASHILDDYMKDYEDKGSSIIEDLRETLNGLKCVYQSSQGDPPCGAQPGWVPDPERCDRYLSELPEDLFQALRCSWATTTTWVPPARMRAPACGPNSAAVD